MCALGKARERAPDETRAPGDAGVPKPELRQLSLEGLRPPRYTPEKSGFQGQGTRRGRGQPGEGGARGRECGEPAAAAEDGQVAHSGADIQLSLPDLAPGAPGCKQPGSRWQLRLLLLTWPVPGTEPGRRWPKFGAQPAGRGDAGATAPRAPEAKAGADRRLLRPSGIPAQAAALTKIGIAAAASGAGASPRTRPAPPRTPAGGARGFLPHSPRDCTSVSARPGSI